MAKYDVTYSCGHTGTVQLYGKNEDRARKIESYERYSLCPECYKKQKQEEDEKLGLLICGVVDSDLSEDGEVRIRMYFKGDTMPHKEEIRGLGYSWRVIDDTQILSTSRPDMGWVKLVPYSSLEEEKEKAFSIGAKEADVSQKETDFQKSAFEEMLAAKASFLKHNKIMLEKKQQLKEKLNGLCPVEPGVIRGKRWNQKVYGKAGRYSIYPDGEKQNISDEEAEKLKKYLEDLKEYTETVRKLKEEAGI